MTRPELCVICGLRPPRPHGICKTCSPECGWELLRAGLRRSARKYGAKWRADPVNKEKRRAYVREWSRRQRGNRSERQAGYEGG